MSVIIKNVCLKEEEKKRDSCFDTVKHLFIVEVEHS